MTVVIPAHGPGPYLAEAVASALAEEAAEVIVVEDGTQGVEESGLGGARLLRLPHVRRSRARNTGVEEAKTRYVAFLDEDDLCLPGRLERQRQALAAAPGATLCYGRVRMIAADGATLAAETASLRPRFDRLVAGGSTYETVLELGGPLYTSATMVRRDPFLTAGGFDPAFDAYEDLDLYLRLSRDNGLVPCLGEPVTAYRMHPANTPSDALYRGTLGVTAKHLPHAHGRAKRLLLERRVDALWGLGEFRSARGEALAAARSEPRLLSHPRFLKRLAGLTLPTKVLESRR